MSSEKPKFIHDTWRILDCNDAACALFRCEKDALIDLDMMHLVADPDFRGLARLRMVVMRDAKLLPPIKYKFYRFDGTVFWGEIADTKMLFDGNFETTLAYEGEA